jgi:hypothetical protein
MLWRFEDATGVWRTGRMQRFTDYGGTDVTYWFLDEEERLHLVSGQRLKAAYTLAEAK